MACARPARTGRPNSEGKSWRSSGLPFTFPTIAGDVAMSSDIDGLKAQMIARGRRFSLAACARRAS